MANKIEPHAQEILRLKAEGQSIRAIATTLGLPSSSVHHFLKGSSNGSAQDSGESEDPVSNESVDRLDARLESIDKKLKAVESMIGLWDWQFMGIVFGIGGVLGLLAGWFLRKWFA